MNFFLTFNETRTYYIYGIVHSSKIHPYFFQQYSTVSKKHSMIKGFPFQWFQEISYLGIFHPQTAHLYFLPQYSTVSKIYSMTEYSTVSRMHSIAQYLKCTVWFFFLTFNETRTYDILGIVHPHKIYLYSSDSKAQNLRRTVW